MRAIGTFSVAVWILIAGLTAGSIWSLEQTRASTDHRVWNGPAGPVHIYAARDDAPGPLVVVTHGFAGSVQLMQTISRDLAQAGFTVAAFDFLGHGRNTAPLSPDVTRLEGTTAQLVAQTRDVVAALRRHLDMRGPIALVGHSMATDIIIRAAEQIDDVAAIAAISMYSDAVTPDAPQRLLIVSGQWEARLRDVALRNLAQLTPDPVEGQTYIAGPVSRRAVSAPFTEHASVLFSAVTLQEIRAWLGDALPHDLHATAPSPGWRAIAVLLGFVALIFPMTRWLKSRAGPRMILTRTQFGITLASAGLAGCAGLFLAPAMVAGNLGFGHLIGFFAGWGIAALISLGLFGYRPQRPDILGILLLLGWGIVFACALDRYLAAFLPVGSRGVVGAALALGTVPFMLADRVLLDAAPVWRKVVARALPLVLLSSAMAALPTEVGLMFTVLPVLLLFFAVYGTLGHAVSRRSGPETSGAALGVLLAWSIAASTPLFGG